MNDMETELKKRPWLRPFVEDGDETIEPAQERWSEAVSAGVRALEALGVTVFARMRTEGGLETTALMVSEQEEVR